MREYTHAWIALKAIQFLKDRLPDFHPVRQGSAERLLGFLSHHASGFLGSARFPDNMLPDVPHGRYALRYGNDPSGKIVRFRPPSHHQCLPLVRKHLMEPVRRDIVCCDLPDQCEALSQTIRDATVASVMDTEGLVCLNCSRVAVYLLMLANHVADACVPLRCDSRDFHNIGVVLLDTEDYWESAVKRFHWISVGDERFDLNAAGHIHVKTNMPGWDTSILRQCDDILASVDWQNMTTANGHWSALLGHTNQNIWDYVVSVCRVSFQMSLLMYPLQPERGVKHNALKLEEVSPHGEQLARHSSAILADAIMSVALTWLATWERREQRSSEVRRRVCSSSSSGLAEGCLRV